MKSQERFFSPRLKFSWLLFLNLLLQTVVVSEQDPSAIACLGEVEFFFFTVAADFQTADEICIQNGGRIGRITNVEEFSFVAELRNLAGIFQYWLGNSSFDWYDCWLHVLGVDARGVGGNADVTNFFYTDGTQTDIDFIHTGFATFPWSGGEPNDAGGQEDCVKYTSLNLFAF